jgi:ribosomal protein S18 acetylase RimI-like enzyme
MARLLPSPALIGRTIAAELGYTIARLEALARLPGNPIGVAIRRIDDEAVALMARHLPSPSFNSVVGLRPGGAGEVAGLLAWYRDAGVRPRFEIVPGRSDDALLAELARRGCRQSGFHASLIAEPAPTPEAPAAGVVERVTDEAGFDAFLDAYAAGWGIPAARVDQFKRNVRPWLGLPGWALYAGRADGRVGAAGILFVRDGVGYFADAATDPAFRGRGLQAALLARRWREAAAAGVDFVCSGADPLSTSHRNMERIGLRLQFLRAIWTPI